MSEELQGGVAPTSLTDELISEAEAAKMLGRSRQWLRNLRLDGEGPVYVDLGNSVEYYPSDVREWLHNRRKAPKKVARKTKPKASAGKKAVTKRAAESKAPTQE